MDYPILKKCEFGDFLKSMFLQSRKAIYLSRTSLNTFIWRILNKKEEWEKFEFLITKMD